jgi:hypothetical protein
MARLKARNLLQHYADALRATHTFVHGVSGPQHQPVFTVYATWRLQDKEVQGDPAEAGSKVGAYDAAASNLIERLRELGIVHEKQSSTTTSSPLDTTPLQRLEEFLTKHPNVELDKEEIPAPQGTNFAVKFTVGRHSVTGTGSTKQKAKQDAAGKLLSLIDHRGSRLLAVDAWCGDRAHGLLVGLLGRKAGLGVEELNSLEEELFSNEAMHDATGATQRLNSARTTGTQIEADTGANLDAGRLIELLEAAMSSEGLSRLKDALAARRTAAPREH